MRKKLEQTITTVDGFGRTRSIMNTLGNIKDPEVVNKSINQTPEKNFKIALMKKTKLNLILFSTILKPVHQINIGANYSNWCSTH